METVHKTSNQSYYKIDGHTVDSNLCDTSVELAVNCCGEVTMRERWGHRRPSSRRDFYLIYSTGGDIVGTVAGVPINISGGQVICIRPETEYKLGCALPMTEWTHYYWIHFTGHGAEKMLEHSAITPNTVYEIGQLEALYTYYENLFSEFRTRSEDFEYNSALQLRYIVYTIGQAKRERTVSRLDRSIRYIHTHLRYDLSVERLSEMEFLGVSRYRELFKDATGTSPQEYIARLRMERAKYLLSQTDMTIADVAEAVGYENRQYFQNVFRARVGITPGKFRKG